MGFWFTLLLYVGTFLLSELLRPKPNIEGAKPASLGDFQFPTSEEGRAVPIIWGTVRLNGPNVGWYGDLLAEPITEEVDTGLFSSENVTVGYKYYLGIDLMLCRGEFDVANTGLRRIWVDDEILRPLSAGWIQSGTVSFNSPSFFGSDSGGIVGSATLFAGSAGQAQSSYMAGVSDIDATLLPNYRGTAHLVLEQLYIGNQPNLRPWSFELRRIPNPLSLATGDAIVNGRDANPANVIYEIMTNSEWGLGLANIDEAQFITAAQVLSTENNGYARILDRPQEAAQLLAEIEQQIDGFLVQDVISKEWQIRLIRETDYPSPITSLPLFDESNLLSFEFSRGSWVDTTNQVKVQFTDSEKNFKNTFAVAQDMANKVIQGGVDVIASQVYPGVQDRSLANALAWRDLRTLSYPLAKGKMKADRSNYAVLPGDLVRINWPPFNIEEFYARINRVSLGSNDANEIIYDWTEDVFRTETPSFSDPTDSLWIQIDSNPVDVIAARIIALPLGYQDVSDSQQYGLLAVRGNGVQTSYNVYIYEDPSLPPTENRTPTILDGIIAPFTPSALLDGPIGIQNGSPNSYNDDVITINATTDIALVNQSAVLGDLDNATPPNLALIDDEWVFFESITSLGGGQYQMNGVHRGMLDSAPIAHVDNTRVWFVTYGIGRVNLTPGPSTVALVSWFQSNAGGGQQGDPNGSPEIGVAASTLISDRYLGPGAPVNVSIDGVRLGDVVTLGDTFNVNWRSRVPSFTDRSKTQEDPHESGSGYTYNVRIYHTGVSPEVEVYNVTGITADGGTSPVGGTHAVSGYAVDFSPITSPWPSPQPFGQTYRLEIEAQDGSPEKFSQKWEHEFTRA